MAAEHTVYLRGSLKSELTHELPFRPSHLNKTAMSVGQDHEAFASPIKVSSAKADFQISHARLDISHC